MTQASGVPGIEAKHVPPPATPAVSPPGTAVIVFDGVCVLCNGWVRFLFCRAIVPAAIASRRCRATPAARC